MFEEDDSGDVLLAPNVKTISGAAAAKILASTISDVLGLADPIPAPETGRVKTLREMLYDQEPWHAAGRVLPSAGIRRLQEKRVNRVLDAVANWMLQVVEQRIGDEMTLVILLELAETVREQIVWPELEAYKAAEAQELENGEKQT